MQYSSLHLYFNGQIKKELYIQDWISLEEKLLTIEKDILITNIEKQNQINQLIEEYGLYDIKQFGRYHCSPGYTDYLNLDKSYIGPNPETLKKLEQYRKWLQDLDNIK